jgi:uncharacterized OsmC-like protein
VWAAKRDVALDRINVEIREDLDTRGLLGVADDVRPGCRDVRVAVELTGLEPVSRHEALRRLVDDHCPVLDTFTAAVPVTTSAHLSDWSS